MMHLTLQLFLIIMLFCCSATAQHPYYYTINDEDGLPSNEVYQVKQDAFGFMWIACDAGLYQYDGFTFIPHRNKRQNSRSLSNLIIDNHQQIFCQNFTGQIFKTKADADSMTLVYDGSNNSRIAPVYTVDSNSHVWIATDSAIIVLNEIGDCIKKITLEDLGTDKNVWFDIKLCQHQIYALNYKAELFIIDVENYNIEQHKIKEDKTSRLRLFCFDERIILLTEKLPIRHYTVADITGGEYNLMADFAPLTTSGLNYTITKCQDNLVLCTSTGAVFLDEQFKYLKPFKHILKDHKISYSYCDKEGNYWFTSLQDGIFVVPSIDLKVLNTQNSILNDHNISTISLVDDSLIYLGNYSGELYRYNPPLNTLRKVKENSESKYRAVRKIKKQGTNLYTARGLFSIDNRAQTKMIPTLNNVRDFVVTGDTIFYTRSDLSGYIYKLNKEWKHNILKQTGGKKVLLDKARNIVYYACTNGLFQYKEGTLKEITYQQESIFGSSLFLDGNTLWVGTNNKGVLLLENSTVKEEFSSKKWLSDKQVKAMVKHEDKLFVACHEGLNVIDLKKRTAYIINKFDGLAYTELHEIIILNKELYLATIKGLVSLPLKLKWENRVAPKVKITGVKKNNESLDIQKPISLNYDDNNLNIAFIATAFRSRTEFSYNYRLKNFEDGWHSIKSNRPSVLFSSIPPGAYVFEVIAINEDGIASNIPASILINVYAPIWQKWWFYLLLSVVFVGIIALIFRARLKFIQHRAEIKNQLVASQLTALKAQMNPHFMYNALNSIQALIIQKETKKANFYLNKFSLLMRKVLSASGEDFISLHDEIEWLSLYLELEKLRFGEDFEYQFITDKNLDIYELYIPSMILQPFIENAVKHGLLHKKGKKKLRIEFEYTDKLICVISDNGVGRKKVAEIQKRLSRQHESFATKATQNRIELLNNRTKDKYSFEIIDLYEDDQAIGTKVIVMLPIEN